MTTSSGTIPTPKPKINSPAWNHIHTLLPQLITLFRDNSALSALSTSELRNPEHPPDNIHFMYLFCKETLQKLLKVPPDLPVNKEKEWEDVVARCEWIDGMVNDDTGDLDAVTGQYPGQTEFGKEEKEAAKLLAMGLQELLMEM